jgi:parvulin-like peptidyl-prolyl isomerase
MQHHRYAAFVTLVLLISVAGCKKASTDKTTGGSAGSAVAAGSGSAGVGSAGVSAGSAGAGAGSNAPLVPDKDLDSKDLLARTETAPQAYVKHVLIGWKELAPTYRGQMDPRAANRSNADAAKLAEEVAAKLKANPDTIDAVVKERSEDPGSASGEPYDVKPDSRFVPEFKNLALRLKEKEVGIVKTAFGYHVMERVAPPPPDPIESHDILKREPPETGAVKVQHVLISWKDTPMAKSGRMTGPLLTRTREEADKIAKDVLAKITAGGDMAKLMKQFSDDAGSKEEGTIFDITPAMQLPEPFKNMALRLKLNEAGIVKTPFGLHVMKRVPPPPPPPPDKLDSVDILKRDSPAAKVKVKHILLSSKEMSPRDERGKKRDRATLDKLVKDVVAKLKKGDKIEPLMADLSEDQGSATGTEYEVAPGGGFVEPFTNLSLRLKVDEVGVVKTQFGIHIIKRIE